jgi:hypothetical protein
MSSRDTLLRKKIIWERMLTSTVDFLKNAQKQCKIYSKKSKMKLFSENACINWLGRWLRVEQGITSKSSFSDKSHLVVCIFSNDSRYRWQLTVLNMNILEIYFMIDYSYKHSKNSLYRKKTGVIEFLMSYFILDY